MRPNLFKKRLETFYSSWNRLKENQWGNSDCLVICSPPEDSSDDRIHPISSSFLVWLIGDRLPSTIVVFAQNEIFFICTKKSFPNFKTIAGPAMESVGATVLMHKMDKNEDMSIAFDLVLKVIKRKYKAEESLKIGYVSGETPKSRITWNCENNLKQFQFQMVLVNDGFTRLCAKNHEKLYADWNEFDIQMQSLPDNVAQMLSLSPKAQVQKSYKIEENRINFEEGREESSEKSSKIDEDDDEWILVDADEEADRIETGCYGYIWRKLPIS